MAFRVILTAAVLILLTQECASQLKGDEGANSDRCSIAGAASLLMDLATLHQDTELDPITIVVRNIFQKVEKTYTASVAQGGILIGAMKRLMKQEADFQFTYIENVDYGPYLKSINCVAENPEDHTYWELLVIEPDGSIVKANVGIGCYIPSPNEQILFNFTKWEPPQ